MVSFHLQSFTCCILSNSENLGLVHTMQVSGLTWGEWDEPLFDLHPDIILGADVLYDSASELPFYSTVFSVSIITVISQMRMIILCPIHSLTTYPFPFVLSLFWLTDIPLRPFGKILMICSRR